MKKYSHFHKYLSYFIVGVLGLSLITGLFNWFIDPFGTYNSPRIKYLNAKKPMADDCDRLLQSFRVRKIKPNTVILGSSIAWVGINPENPVWSFEPVYNLSFNNPFLYEIEMYFQHANNIHRIKQSLIIVDFFNFSTIRTTRSGFDKKFLSLDCEGNNQHFSYLEELKTTLFTFDTLLKSFKTVAANIIGWDKHHILEDGFSIVRPDANKSIHDKVIESTKTFVLGTPVQEYQFEESNTSPTNFEAYRNILKLAYKNDIDLRVAISPLHAYQWEAYAAEGLWPKVETWKRMLTKINQEESQLAGKPPIQLWDFSEYNEFTTEEVPPAYDKSISMKWYMDSVHPTEALGNMMLYKIFNYAADNNVSLENFGTLISIDNIEEHIAKVREEREIYRQTHPNDIAEIENMVKKLTSPTD